MDAIIIAGAGFLLAVLWFDLMFDVQVRGHVGTPLPDEVLASISAYYKRVTTGAHPMNRLVVLVMLGTIVALVADLVRYRGPGIWIDLLSLACTVGAVGLAMRRTVPNAVKLGSGAGTIGERSAMARQTYIDHVFCFILIFTVLWLKVLEQF